MIIVDTSVWIDHFNNISSKETKKLSIYLTRDEIAIGDLILVEVLQGIKKDSEYFLVKSLLSHLPFYRMLSKAIALKSTENYRNLRKKGFTIRKTIDVIIATFCIDQQLPLLTSDRDFKPFCALGLILL